MSNQAKLPARGLKQVKVDNWGAFFLQRLQQLYFEEEFLDLTIKFPTSDITVQAHRLVISTCTDYFIQLERQQKEKDDNFDGIIIMPPDMPYECVKSIISFMYTGQLEYWTSEQNALYKTAQKMNMPVLTKLLDAQFNNSGSTPKTTGPVKTTVQSTSGGTKSPVKKATPSILSNQPLPGRKLPIWKRKLDTGPSYDVSSYHGSSSYSHNQRANEATAGPSRFDLPEADDMTLGVFSSFDDITYDTKPIVRAADCAKKSGTDTRREDTYQSLAGDFDEEDESLDSANQNARQSSDGGCGSDDDWPGSKVNEQTTNQHGNPTPVKRVRFDLDEKENLEKSKEKAEDAINNHAKIIKEVLKKYPHLVKNRKNIRLKIMQKESKASSSFSSDASGQPRTKVSYVVLKSDHLLGTGSSGSGTSQAESDESKHDGSDTGPWKCNKCDLDDEYTNYYMYRRHMQDVHDEKFDPRVCEHCGFKATKRNILMYHMYTKHNVPPPKSMSFPKCHACPYIALSESLLVRHQINHNHRPATSSTRSASDDIECYQCGEVFKSVEEFNAHEISSGHPSSSEGKDKGHRCIYCGKFFVRITNLQVHLDCAHKDVREGTTSGSGQSNKASHHQEAQPAVNLEPSSEAEALSHVASGIAASLGVADTIVQDASALHPTQYIVPEMELAVPQDTYNGHEMQPHQMIMLIEDGSYKQVTQLENQQQQQPAQHLEISPNEQLVMQSTDEGMIVYIHGNEENGQIQYADYQAVGACNETVEETEEIVEEVVEEVEEEVIEESSQVTMEDGTPMNTDQVEQQVIQFVEEQTEIVEYDDASETNVQNLDNRMQDTSVMIIENQNDKQSDNKHIANEQGKEIANEWDVSEDSADT